jgi:thiamine pyrophosphate-dependent acetolactate synthase large subunit-like protein
MASAVQYRLPVKVIVYNNSALGLITLEAERASASRHSTKRSSFLTLISPHWPAPVAVTDLRRGGRVI